MDTLAPIILLVTLIIIIRPLTVLIHELGHAIPAILMTKEKVKVYIGSLGDSEKNKKFSLGLMEIYFQQNPLTWRCGLCIATASNISFKQQIIYTFMGPLSSFIAAGMGGLFVFTIESQGFLKLIFTLFTFSSLFDFLVTVIPNETPIKVADGSITYNDGYQLKRLYRFMVTLKRQCAIDLTSEESMRVSEASKNKPVGSGASDGSQES